MSVTRTLTDDLLDLCVQEGLALEKEAQRVPRPPDPVRCLVIYRYPGETPSSSLDKTVIDKPRVQFTFRDRKSLPAERWAEQVYDWFSANGENLVINGLEYVSIEPITSPASIGEDDKRNPIFAFNARIDRVTVEDGASVRP
jgi:hypothetical protein